MPSNGSIIDELYKDVILEHSKRPHHYGPIENADRIVEGYNPLCGDRITIYLDLEENGERLGRVHFTGQGCAICNASASMMTDAVEHKSKAEALEMHERFRRVIMTPVSQDLDENDLEVLGDLAALSGVRRLPMRVKCAILAWHALREALERGDEATTVSTE